jgi:hypothetical protein
LAKEICPLSIKSASAFYRKRGLFFTAQIRDRRGRLL